MKLLLIGNYGAGNYGDEAILVALASNLMNEFPGVKLYIMSSNSSFSHTFAPAIFNTNQIEFVPFLPFGIRSLFKAVFRRTYRKTIQAYRESDVVILGGGGLFADDESIKAPMLWGSHAKIAHFFKKPLFTFGLGIGPINKNISKFFIKKGMSDAVYVGTRDQNSLHFIHSLIQKEGKVSPDPVFLLDLKNFETPSLNHGNDPYIIFSVRPWKLSQNLYKKFAQLLDSIVAIYSFKIIFLPFQRNASSDTAIMNKIIGHMQHATSVLCERYPLKFSELLGCIKNARAVIGMRLHSLFFSILTNTPHFPIIYSDKQMSFLRESLNTLAPYSLTLQDIEMLSSDGIFQKIALFFKNHEYIKETYKNTEIRLKNDARHGFLTLKNTVEKRLDRSPTF